MLEDGKVFDQNVEPVKKKLPPALSFKVGTGKVIRGVSIIESIYSFIHPSL